MRKLISITLAFTLTLSTLFLTTALSALAANSTPETAEELSAARPVATGSLVGQPGGAFAYYAFQYPGANLPIVVTLNVDHPHGSMGNAIGFNLYGPNGSVGSGVPLDGNPDSTIARLPMSQPAAGRYLIQVHNYTDGRQLNFSVDVVGLVGTPQTATGSDRPETAPVLQSPQPAMAGTLTGRSSGAHAFFQLEYPGGGTVLDITVTFNPRYTPSRDALGFHLWRGSDLVGRSSEVQQSGDVVAHVLRYEGVAPESFGLEIFNYGEGHTVSYTVAATGLADPPTPVSDNTSPDRAATIQAGQAAYTGSIVGQRSGAFGFFTVAHPGGGQQVRIILDVAREDRLDASEVGFNIYDGSQLVAHAPSVRDESGRLVATVLLDSATARTYGIQVFNYSDGAPATYRIYGLGL